MKGKSSLRADDTIALENAPDLVNENLLRWACATRKKNDVKRAKKPGREIAKIECLFTNAFPTKGTINSLYPTMVFFVCFDGSWKGDRKSVSKTGHLCKTYLTHDRMIFFYRGSLLPSFFFLLTVSKHLYEGWKFIGRYDRVSNLKRIKKKKNGKN